MVLQGGAGSIDILNSIDYDIIKDHPKVFIGSTKDAVERISAALGLKKPIALVLEA